MTQIPELPWVEEGRKYIGLKEIPGAGTAAPIKSWLQKMKVWWDNDEEPWCGTFVNNCLRMARLDPPAESYRARSYLNLPVRLNMPAYGAIGVIKTARGYHVGIVVGVDKKGNLMLLGGNQNNQVSIAPFARSAFVGFRWPSVYPAPHRFVLPVLTSDGKTDSTTA